MSYVLALALGPVQEFIAAARKARDLWAGSRMLSDCSRAAALALQEGGAELVFPAPADLVRGASVANKIVAIVGDGGDPAALAIRAREAAQAVLAERQKSAWQTIMDKGAHAAVDGSLMTDQVREFLEFYAAWHPFAEAAAYNGAREGADRLLAGRKALRDFAPPPASPGRQKSALDPSRESVLSVPPRRSREYDAAVARLALLQVRPTEFLDGVSLIKRTADRQQFVSVSRVAVDPFVRRLARDRPDGLRALCDLGKELALGEKTPVQRIRGEHLAHYGAFPYDTQLFYDDEPLEEFAPSEESTAKKFQCLVRELRGARGLAVGEIPPYFAVLVADGDRMGRAISALGQPERHEALSRALAGFATQAEAVVSAHNGALIYSGGDDVLAFLPADRVLDCADTLQAAFRDALVGLGLAETPTLSVGVSLGHFGTALDRLLEWGRQAEKQAKTLRNALAVTLHTRSSGETGIGTVTSWQEDPVAGRWRRWVRAYREDAIPAGFAYKLRGLAEEIEGAAARGHDTGGLLAAEVRRLLEKSRSRRGSAKIEGEMVQGILGSVGDDPGRLKQVVTELLIARHLARAQETAEGPGATVGAAPGEDG